MRVTHALVAGDPQNPRIDHDDWNADHIVSEDIETITTETDLETTDTNKVYLNTGAASVVPANLPAGAEGLKFTFLVTDSSGFEINADGSDTIQLAGSNAGTFTCTQLGGALVLYGYTGGWIAASSQRTWIDS